MNKCPPGDEDAIVASALINCAVWLYQAGLFAYISHRLFAEPGQIRPELILVSGGLATFVLIFDAYAINRASFFQSGASELARAGLDISGGLIARSKNGIFYVVRVVLSAGLAQLTAVFMLIMVFASDLDARIQQAYRNSNSHLIIAASQPVDDAIARAGKSVADQKARVSALAAQVSRLQASEIDPSAANPHVQQAQQEVAQLLARKSKLDEGLEALEVFRNNEVAGVKGDGNSGLAGHGPNIVRRSRKVADTKAHLEETARELDLARARLEALRKRQQQGPALEAVRLQAHDQLAVFEARLREENAELSNLNEKLTRLSNGRGDAIRANIEKSPDHVRLDNGLFAQIQDSRGDRAG